MRVVFVGASGFGLRCLQAALELPGVELVGAVTAPSRFNISYRPQGVTNVLFADVGEVCREHGIPCETMTGKATDPGLYETVERWAPDMFLVVGWYHMVPRRWRELAPAYGLHASLLPDYSGGAPLVWAIINGERETGITLFELGDGVDSGPIVGQAATPIAEDDTIATLYERIEQLGFDLIREHLPRLADGTATLTVQDESRRRLVPQRGPEDGLIDWSWPAKAVYDFVRAQTRPYPGAFTFLDGRKLTIWAATVSEEEAPQGRPERRGASLAFGCGDGRSILVGDVSIDGAAMAAVDVPDIS